MNQASIKRALFPGTFDPMTNGHLDLAVRAAKLFPRIAIAVAHSEGKIPLFTMEERQSMIRETIQDQLSEAADRFEILSFDGLLVDLAKEIDAQVMIRGLRAVSDFEFEFQMALMNRHLDPDLEIVYLMPDARYTYLNSSLVKEVVRLGGDVRGLVPPVVWSKLKDRLRTVGSK